jgi:hypothetical protein
VMAGLSPTKGWWGAWSHTPRRLVGLSPQPVKLLKNAALKSVLPVRAIPQVLKMVTAFLRLGDPTANHHSPSVLIFDHGSLPS